MINFNKININILSVLITSIIFLILISIIKISSISNDLDNKLIYFSNQNLVSNELNETKTQKSVEDINIKDITKWQIKIDKLKLNADIKQLQGENAVDEYVGHLKETTILGNNIGLIAYNFGKVKNYFSNLKDLRVGDKITYIVNNESKTYSVILNKIIESKSLKDVLKVNNQNEFNLKLFTYVKDLSDKLRYVCAKEIIDI